MDWKELYQQKLRTLDEAADLVKSNDRVVLGHAMGEPQAIMRKMVEKKNQYRDVEIVQLVPYTGMFNTPELAGHFRYNALFAGGSTRGSIEEGRADFTPVFFHEVPRLFQYNILKVDVALIMVSPPDEHGYCSYGISVDYTKAAAEYATTVIAQVNKYMPRTFGNSMIHVTDIDALVEYDEELPELPPAEIGELERKIGEYCASLVKDGSVLQVGIGAIPDAVLASLGDKKDLALHTELVGTGVIPLIKNGVINNKKKSYMPDMSVGTFIMGTKELYDFVDNNPSIYMGPVDFVNKPSIIAKNDRMISINSAIQVDLTGQVVSDTMGHRVFSGVGGQVDFVRGAAMANEGVSIIAFASTAKGGKISKIVTDITPGSAVTTTRNDVDYIVTEYGIAALKGRTLRQRAEALTKIAHPDFREELICAYELRFKQKFPREILED